MAFEERFLAFQHLLVTVDATKDSALACTINCNGHGLPSNQFSTLRLRILFKVLKHCSLENNQVPADTPTVNLLLKSRSISPEPLPPGFLELGENG
jgi:hypothetical protein